MYIDFDLMHHQFSEQHNRLIVRVQMLCAKKKEMDLHRDDKEDKAGIECVHWKKHNDLHDETDSFLAPNHSMKSLKFSKSSLVLSPKRKGHHAIPQHDDDDSDCDNVSDSHSSTESLHRTTSHSVSTKEFEAEKSELRLLFRQMYHAVRMLEQYRAINELAFDKITKKHDKNSGIFRTLRPTAHRLIRMECNFGNDYFTKFLQKRLEYLYSLYLKPSDHTAGQAIERLRHPPSTKQIQTESCVIGLCGGWSIALMLVIIVLIAVFSPYVWWTDREIFRAWYLFTASTCVSVYLWLWGCDLWVFQRYGFNHAFIFGADPS